MRNVLISGIVGAVIVGTIAYFTWGREAERLQQQVQSSSAPPTPAPAAASSPAAPPATTAAPPAAAPLSAKRRATVITLYKDKDDEDEDGPRRCRAKVEDPTVNGRQQRKVAWIVEDDEEMPCRPEGGWRVELDFEAIDGQYPFGNGPNGAKTVRIGDDVRAHRIRKTGAMSTTRYSYKVYMQNQLLEARYMLVDPDLEVEPPMRLVPPAPPPPLPANQSPAAPAKTAAPAKKP